MASFDEFLSSMNPFSGNARAAASVFPRQQAQTLQSRPGMDAAARDLLASAIQRSIPTQSGPISFSSPQQMVSLADLADAHQFSSPIPPMMSGAMPRAMTPNIGTNASVPIGGMTQESPDQTARRRTRQYITIMQDFPGMSVADLDGKTDAELQYLIDHAEELKPRKALPRDMSNIPLVGGISKEVAGLQQAYGPNSSMQWDAETGTVTRGPSLYVQLADVDERIAQYEKDHPEVLNPQEINDLIPYSNTEYGQLLQERQRIQEQAHQAETVGLPHLEGKEADMVRAMLTNPGVTPEEENQIFDQQIKVTKAQAAQKADNQMQPGLYIPDQPDFFGNTPIGAMQKDLADAWANASNETTYIDKDGTVKQRDTNMPLGVKVLGAVEGAMNLFDLPRQEMAGEVGNWAYQYVNGGSAVDSPMDAVSVSVIMASSAIDWAAHMGGKDWSETFAGWVKDPENKDKINDAYENGFGELRVDVTGDGQPDAVIPAYEGGSAVWELFASEQTKGSRAVYDIAIDPTVWGTIFVSGPLAKLGTRLTESADLRYALTGDVSPGRKIVGELLQVPNAILTAPDRLIEAVPKTISKAVPGAGSLTDDALHVIDEEQVGDLALDAMRVDSGTSGAASTGAYTPPGGAPAPPGFTPPGPPPGGYRPPAPPGTSPLGSPVGFTPAPSASPGFTPAPGSTVPPGGTAGFTPAPGSTVPPGGVPGGITPATASPASPGFTPAPTGGVGGSAAPGGTSAPSDVVARIQWRPNAEGGQSYGNFEEIRRTPDGSLHSFVHRGNMPEGQFVDMGPVPEDYPQMADATGWSIHVTSADSAEAVSWGSVPDSAVPPTDYQNFLNQLDPGLTPDETVRVTQQWLRDHPGAGTTPATPPGPRPEIIRPETDDFTPAPHPDDMTPAQAETINTTPPASADELEGMTTSEKIEYAEARAQAERMAGETTPPDSSAEDLVDSPASAERPEKTAPTDTGTPTRMGDRIDAAVADNPELTQTIKQIDDETQAAVASVDKYDTARYPSGYRWRAIADENIAGHAGLIRKMEAALQGGVDPAKLAGGIDLPPLTSKIDREMRSGAYLPRIIYGSDDEAEQAIARWWSDIGPRDRVGWRTVTGPDGSRAIVPPQGARAGKDEDTFRQVVNEALSLQQTYRDLPLGETIQAEAPRRMPGGAGIKPSEITRDSLSIDKGRFGQTTVSHPDSTVSVKTKSDGFGGNKGVWQAKSSNGDVFYGTRQQAEAWAEDHVLAHTPGRTAADTAANMPPPLAENAVVPPAPATPVSGDAAGFLPGAPLRLDIASEMEKLGATTGGTSGIPRGTSALQPELADAVRKGDMNYNRAAALNQKIIGKGSKKPISIYDYFVWNIGTKGRSASEVTQEVVALMEKQGQLLYDEAGLGRKITKRTEKSTVQAALSVPGQFAREVMMLNPYTGYAGALRDAPSNAFLVGGRSSWWSAARIWKEQMGKILRKEDLTEWAKRNSEVQNALGVNEYSTTELGAYAHSGLVGGDQTLAQRGASAIFGKSGGNKIGALLASSRVRYARQAADVVSRHLLRGMKLAEHVSGQRARFLVGVRQDLERWGYSNAEALELVNSIYNSGSIVDGKVLWSPTNIREALAKGGVEAGRAEAIARRWRNIIADGEKSAGKDVADILFSYRMTKADNAVSKVLLFHYWQTRAIYGYSRVVARNPALLRIGYELNSVISETSDDPALPRWQRGALKFMSAHFWDIFVNPAQALVPMFQFSQLADADGDYEWWNVMEAVGVTPLLMAGAAIWNPGGIADKGYQAPNVFGTSSVERFANMAADGVRNYVLPELLDNDDYAGVSNLSFGQWASNVGVEALNGLIGSKLPASEPISYAPTDASKKAQVNDIITELYMAQNGLDDETELANPTGAYGPNGEPLNGWDEVAVIIESIGTDEIDPIALEALQVQTKRDAAVVGVGMVSPLAISTYYRPRLEEWHEKHDTPGSPEAEAEYTQDAITTSAAPSFSAGVENYRGIGDDYTKGAAAVYNDLTYATIDEMAASYGVDPKDPNFGIVIGWNNGPVTMSIWQLTQMSTDERQKVADQWAEYNGIANQIQGYKEEREQFRADNPEVDAFLSWQQEKYDMAEYSGDPTRVADLLAAMSPAYADWYRKLNPSKRTDPNVLFSDEAYLMFTKGQASVYDSPGKVGDTAAFAQYLMLQEMTKGAKDDAYKAAEKKEKAQKERAKADLFDEEQSQGGATGDTGGLTYEEKLTTEYDDYMIGWNLYLKAKEAEDAYGKDYNGPTAQKPYKSGDLSDYLDWVDNMTLSAPGSDTSIQAYIAYLNANGLEQDRVTKTYKEDEK